ncbi:hypothetical protein KIN20_024881 [Parelaphostrongylus tenuis]|uniref:Uncharacterized protein n=1 Tax=Parelaphostrongylus tenuis TaxID=148309 RepID=A0AAD5NBH3_PARTN|nr:hypothetical protein KIN20_024881 [Parelaphostrongylus tenuis]
MERHSYSLFILEFKSYQKHGENLTCTCAKLLYENDFPRVHQAHVRHQVKQQTDVPELRNQILQSNIAAKRTHHLHVFLAHEQ